MTSDNECDNYINNNINDNENNVNIKAKKRKKRKKICFKLPKLIPEKINFVGNTYKCSLCDNILSSSKHLAEHLTSCHGNYKEYICLKCHKQFYHYNSYQQHCDNCPY